MKWTAKQTEAAQREGWDIFDAEGSMCNAQGNWRYQIQKMDEAAILEEDSAAWKLIVAGALKGSALHLATIKYLRAECKPELDLIYRDHLNMLNDENNWEKSILTHDELLDSYERTIFGKVVTRDAG